MEVGKDLTEKKGSNDLVLQISSTLEPSSSNRYSPSHVFSQNSPIGYSLNGSGGSNLELTEIRSLKCQNLMSTVTGSTSPEISVSKPSPTTSKPPKSPNETVIRQVSLARSSFSKPKSRLIEPPYPKDPKLAEEKTHFMSKSNSPSVKSPNNKTTTNTPRDPQKSAPITPRTPLIGTPRGEDDDEDEEAYKTAGLKLGQNPRKKKLKVFIFIEWFAFICIVGFWISTLTVHKLQNRVIWGLELWKWCLLVLVIICGRLFTEWFINILVFLIERNFLLKKKVLYFVYGLKKSVQVFIWIGLVLLAWGLLFNHGVKRSKKTTKILNKVTRALASCLIGAAIWLLKTLLVKLLSTSFQCTKFFDRIQESIFNQYVLRTLSGPPMMEIAEVVGKTTLKGQLSFKNLKKENEEGKQGGKEEVIDVDKLKKMKQERVSAWTMKGLVDVIRVSGLSIISNTLASDDDEDGQQDTEINSEWEAKAAAYRIFQNVAKRGSKYIDEEDLLRLLKKEEVDLVLQLFEGAAETGKIKRKFLKNWLVNVYLERKSLVHSLNDTKTAIEELNRLVSAIIIVVIIIIWLLMMGFLTTQILVFISSQMLLVVFMFGSSAKAVFEAIIFVFVMHPFDVGDRCVVDGIQMVVEEMNILTTVFLRYDNEKIFYPNSVLATKPISNFYRSPEMGDSIEFTVDFSTSLETIAALKARLKGYLEGKPQHWRPGHNVVVKDIENVNKMKIGLYVTHTVNFQNYGDKSSRRSELVLELKKIFEELGIKYRMPSQEVHLNYVGSAASMPPPTWG